MINSHTTLIAILFLAAFITAARFISNIALKKITEDEQLQLASLFHLYKTFQMITAVVLLAFFLFFHLYQVIDPFTALLTGSSIYACIILISTVYTFFKLKKSAISKPFQRVNLIAGILRFIGLSLFIFIITL